MTPEQRRRLTARLMTEQYDRPTPQDTTVTERAGLLPLGTYANGMTGLAFPGFIADPVAGFIREATNPVPYLDRSEPEKRQAVETGFDVAGAAMVGGLAAPKPSNVVGSAGGKLAGESRPGAAAGAAVNSLGERRTVMDRVLSVFGKDADYQPAVPGFPNMKTPGPLDPEVAYRGSKTSRNRFRDPSSRGPWASSDPEIASTYANPNYMQSTSPSVQPMEFRFNNPVEINAKGAAWDSIPTGNWFERLSTDEIGDRLKNSGYDGVIFRNVRDAEAWTDPSTPKSDVYHALKRGTVYSPLTGDLLYANGGKSGAAAGAAVQAPNDAAVNEILRQYGIDLPRRPWSNAMLPGDA